MYTSTNAHSSLELSALFQATGLDRICLRSENPQKRLWEIEESMKLRRNAGVTVESVSQARKLMQAFISKQRCPLLNKPVLDTLVQQIIGDEVTQCISVHMLDTTVQRTGEHRSGSFKDYAPIEVYKRVEAGNAAKKVHSVSTGNHAFAVTNAVAVANQKRGLRLKAVATMDIGACEHKKQNVRGRGGFVREHHMHFVQGWSLVHRAVNRLYRYGVQIGLLPKRHIRSYKEAEDIVNAEAKGDKRCMRVPHDNKHTAAGYAVMAVEAIEQLNEQGIDIAHSEQEAMQVLVPLGSGGLLRGWLEFLHYCPQARVWGVSAPPACMTFDSIRLGKALRIELPADPEFRSDGILATTEATALKAIDKLADGALLVRDEDATMATALLFHVGIEVEPTSGLPLAALLLHTDLFANARNVVLPLTSRHINAKVRKELRSIAKDPQTIFAYFEARKQEIAQALQESDAMVQTPLPVKYSKIAV